MSSASKIELRNSQAPGSSMIYIKNSRGPTIQPRGTPINSYSKSESTPFTWTHWRRSFKTDSNHFKQIPLTPYFSSLANKISRLMESNALCKSSNIHVNVWVFPCLSCSVISARASIVLRLIRKPNCLEWNIFVSSKKEYIRSYMILANTPLIDGFI